MSRKRPGVTKRLSAFYKYGGRCYYCGQKLYLDEWTTDHIVPICKGGTHQFENLVPACASCNQLKGGMLLEEFKETYFSDYKLYYEEVL